MSSASSNKSHNKPHRTSVTSEEDGHVITVTDIDNKDGKGVTIGKVARRIASFKDTNDNHHETPQFLDTELPEELGPQRPSICQLSDDVLMSLKRSLSTDDGKKLFDNGNRKF